MRKPVFGGSLTTQSADQHAHPRSLISPSVFLFLESITSKLATSEISIFYLVSVAEQAGLSLTLSEIPKTGFLATHICSPVFLIPSVHPSPSVSYPLASVLS